MPFILRGVFFVLRTSVRDYFFEIKRAIIHGLKSVIQLKFNQK